MKNLLLLFFFLNLVFINTAVAHGDIHERIVEVTKAIEISPDSAYLYMKRGKLYFQHESYKKSIKDLKISKNLGYHSDEQNLLLARAYFGLKDFKMSRQYCEEMLSAEPRNVRAIKVLARIYYETGSFRKSALTFEKLIDYSNKSLPENYVEASKAWAALDNGEGERRSIAIINMGIETLGNLISLQQRLIELALINEDYNAAIETQLGIIKLSPRKEAAYYRLSELQSLNNDMEEALVSLNLAKTHFNALPVRLQNTASMKALIKNIRSQESHLQLK